MLDDQLMSRFLLFFFICGFATFMSFSYSFSLFQLMKNSLVAINPAY